MAKLPPIRKFRTEDFPSQKSWIDPFLTILNQFVSSMVDALTKSLNIVDNTTSDIKYVTLERVPTISNPSLFAWSKNINPIGISVINVFCSTGDVTLTAAVDVQYKMSTDGKSIAITNVVGITPTTAARYTLTLLCVVG